MEAQGLLDIAYGIISLLAGWMFKRLSDDLKELKTAVKDADDKVDVVALNLATYYQKKEEFDNIVRTFNEKLDKLAGLEVLLATNYVTHKAHERGLDDTFTRLDRIENKLDNKVDKTK
jgi:RNase H-fold protein (predicted Holliday junction resolvase)